MELKRETNENEEQFIWRLGKAKEDGLLDLSWEEIAAIINKEFRSDESEYRTEAAYRKPFSQAARFYEAGVFTTDINSPDYLRELQEQKHEIQKEKQKLTDERTALRRSLREAARKETLYDIMARAVEDYKPINYDYVPAEIEHGDNDLIIHLTDIHCGVTIESPFNVFNSDILLKRLNKYLDEILEIKNLYNAENAYVILGGDLIQGLIHLNARVEAKENLIEQIMKVSDYIANFLAVLSSHFNYVEVHTTAGNHSRSFAAKEETSRGENFDLLVPYVCSKALQNFNNVVFINNYLECDIAAFSVRGHMVYATHGDKDTPTNVVYHMTQFARKANMPLPDICYLGHRHKNGLTTVDGVKVIESGCVDGMDSFAISKRLVGSPEQTVTVVSQDKVIKALCDIQLD